jgi:hypothetical protein
MIWENEDRINEDQYLGFVAILKTLQTPQKPASTSSRRNLLDGISFQLVGLNMFHWQWVRYRLGPGSYRGIHIKNS